MRFSVIPHFPSERIPLAPGAGILRQAQRGHGDVHKP